MQILKLNWFEEGVRILLATLCKLIYPLIAWLYTLFMNISKVNILSSDDVKPIYQRVTLIITIIMVFYVTFEFVKYIVQPDGITDKQKGVGNIVYKMILVVVLIAFVPNIFTWAFKLQTAIVDKGIIGKVIIGQTGNDTDKFGSTFSAHVFSMFYYVEDEYKEEKCGDMTCEQLVSMNLSVLAKTGKLTYLTKDLNATKTGVETPVQGKKAEVALIDFTLNGFLAVIVGGIIAYIMALYCVDVGVRWAQMIFLQIIAPIPIIGYLSPKKDGIFQKWCKQCVTTYLDLFIRIAIIYFMLLICSIILESRLTGNLLEGIEANGVMTIFIYIALILGVMLFAKKAPKMLQELFPSMGAASGNFGLKGGERVPAMAARAIGAGAGGLNRLVKGGIAKAANTRKRNQEIKEKRRAAGKDTSGRAIRQERRQAALDERHAKRQNRQARRNYNKEQRATRGERNDVLNAEKELAKAKRSGNTSRIQKATEDLKKAQAAQTQKKAELKAKEDVDNARKKLNQAKGTKAQTEALNELTAAEQRQRDIQAQGKRQERVTRAEEIAENKSTEVKRIEAEREAKKNAVENAEKELENAKANGDPTAIAAAQNKLNQAIQSRDGSTTIYDQQQIIDSKEAEIKNNENAVVDAQSKHNAATSAVNDAQTKLDTATIQGNSEIAAANSALDAAKSNVDAAKAALDTAEQNGDKKQVEIAQQALDQAKGQEAIAQQALNQAIVTKNIAVSKAQTELTDAQSKQNATKSVLDAAINTRDTNKTSLETERDNAIQTRDAAIQSRDQEYKKAQQAQLQAQSMVEKRKADLVESDTAVADASKQVKIDFEKSQEAYARAQSDRAEIQNQRYRSAVGAAITGSASGLYHGVTTGIKATKIEDIPKQIKEGTKKNNEALAAREKWLDAGGTTTISQIKSSIQKDVGILTDAQVTDMQIKNYDSQISTNKRLSGIEGAVKTHVDNAKSRSGSKIEAGEQKTKMNLEGNSVIQYTDIHGKKQNWINSNSSYNGKSTSEIYQMEKNEAQMAREKAQAAHQAAANAEAQGSANANELKEKAEKAAIEATRKEQELGQKKKALEEYAITSVLKTPEALRRDKMYQPDQVLVEQVENSLQSIEESKRNADTYNKMIAALKDEKVRNAYISGKIEDYDTLDTIQATLSTIKGQRDRDLSTLETMSGILKASSKLDSDKAADGASGK